MPSAVCRWPCVGRPGKRSPRPARSRGESRRHEGRRAFKVRRLAGAYLRRGRARLSHLPGRRANAPRHAMRSPQAQSHSKACSPAKASSPAGADGRSVVNISSPQTASTGTQSGSAISSTIVPHASATRVSAASAKPPSRRPTLAATDPATSKYAKPSSGPMNMAIRPTSGPQCGFSEPRSAEVCSTSRTPDSQATAITRPAAFALSTRSTVSRAERSTRFPRRATSARLAAVSGTVTGAAERSAWASIVPRFGKLVTRAWRSTGSSNVSAAARSPARGAPADASDKRARSRVPPRGVVPKLWPASFSEQLPQR